MRQIDGGSRQTPQRFTPEEFVAWAKKQTQLGDEVHCCYEAGPFGYDRHSNPGSAKGVIFDTNLSYDEESIWYMCEKGRVAAFGDQKTIVHSLRKNDTVFLCHKNQGIIVAGKVATAKVAEDSGADALYHTLEWLTSKPTRGAPYKFMPVWQVKEVLDRDFYWARTIKRPHLSTEESAKLLAALVEIIGPKAP